MKNKKPGIGEFCWFDLQTRGATDEKTFFAKILNWQFQSTVNGDAYHTIICDSGQIGGMVDLDAAGFPKEAPPHISPYIHVADVEQTCQAIKKTKGKVVTPAFELGELGIGAVCSDPFGAEFCLWQPKQHLGSECDPKGIGAITWFELMTTSMDAAVQFYKSIFGWHSKPSKTTDDYFEFFTKENVSVGGMMAITKEMAAGKMRPHWCSYFTVDTCDETLKKVKKAGGRLCWGPKQIKIGKIAGFFSPSNVYFNVMEYD